MRHHVISLAFMLAPLVILSDELLVDCFLKALGITRTPAKVVFVELGLSKEQFSRQTTGVEPPRFLGRLGRLQSDVGLEVVRYFGLFLLQSCGQPALVETAIKTKRSLRMLIDPCSKVSGWLWVAAGCWWREITPIAVSGLLAVLAAARVRHLARRG